MSRLRNFLNRIIDRIINAREPVTPFPPFVFCPVCKSRTYWLTVRKRWRCYEGHEFSERDPRMPLPPPPRMPGDKGDNTDGQI